MNILYLGDVMGSVGLEVVEQLLPEIIHEKSVDVVIAQAENVTEGKSISIDDMKNLQKIGVDFFTGGNHTPSRPEIHVALEDIDQPIIGPANMHDCPGPGFKEFKKDGNKILVVSLLGDTFSSRNPNGISKDNPLSEIDKILHENIDNNFDAIVVNFHGDFSSEKRVIGHYLDGRVTAVVGDHWHVPTADASVLPKGTAHITDVGMCGSLDSSLGVKFESIIPRWRDNVQTKNELETEGRRQLNAVLVTTQENSHRAVSIEQIQRIL